MDIESMKKNGDVSLSLFMLLVLLAYMISVAARYYWIDWASGIDAFKHNGYLVLNSGDGYSYAAIVQKALFGMHEENRRIGSKIVEAITFFTLLPVKYFGIQFEKVLIWLPVLFSSLIVVPMMLMMRLYRLTILGFVAAVFVATSKAYFHRTMAGYYDTDMFVLFMPLFMIAFLMWAAEKSSYRALIAAAISASSYHFFYTSSTPIAFAIMLIYLAYAWFATNKEFFLKSIILLSISMLPLPLTSPIIYAVRIILIIAVSALLKKEAFDSRKLLYFAVTSFALYFIFSGALGSLISQVRSYGFRGTAQAGLHYLNVSATIVEAGRINFEQFLNALFGNKILAFLGLMGYILMLFKYRALIVMLPLLGIGLFSMAGGNRFVMYAEPVVILGMFGLLWILGSKFIKHKYLKYIPLVAAIAYMGYITQKDIRHWRVGVSQTKNSIKFIETIKKHAKPGDYAITWWDYGYPLWFYAGINTLLDGARHSNDNYLMSRILRSDSPAFAARMSRIMVEKYKQIKTNDWVADALFHNHKKDQFSSRELHSFFDGVKTGKVEMPKKSCDMYLYLPRGILPIFGTIGRFSYMDLATGKNRNPMMLVRERVVSQNGALLRLGSGTIIDRAKGMIYYGKEKHRIVYFSRSKTLVDGTIKKDEKLYDYAGDVSVLYDENSHFIYVMDAKTYHSILIQMLMLGNYDSDYFELITKSVYGRIYKFKL